MATIIIGRTLSSAVDSVRADQGLAGVTPWPVRAMNALVPAEFDEIVLTYTPERLVGTAVYKKASVTIATLTLTYVDGLVTNVVRL